MPNHLEQVTAAPPEDKKVPPMRIGLELLLHEQRERRKSLPHVGVTGRQPHAHTRWERNHARPSAETMRATRAALADSSTRTRSPLLNSISMVAEPRPNVPGRGHPPRHWPRRSKIRLRYCTLLSTGPAPIEWPSLAKNGPGGGWRPAGARGCQRMRSRACWRLLIVNP
jgi:hypothetical protein